MLKYALTATTTCLWLLSVADAGDAAEPEQPLECLLRLERTEFHPGEILLLRGNVTNVGERAVEVPAFGEITQFFVCTPRITTPDGRRFRYVPLAGNPSRSSFSSTVRHPTELAPGAVRPEFELALRMSAGQQAWVAEDPKAPAELSLRGPGEYRASFVFRVDPEAGAPESAWTGSLASDEVVFTVRELKPSDRLDEPTAPQLAALDKLAVADLLDTAVLLDDLREQLLRAENEGLAAAAIEFCRQDRRWADHVIHELTARACSRGPLGAPNGPLQLGIDGPYLKTLTDLTVEAMTQPSHHPNALRLFRGPTLDATLAYLKLHVDDVAPRCALIEAARMAVRDRSPSRANPLYRPSAWTILLELDVLHSGMAVGEAIEILGSPTWRTPVPKADDREQLGWALGSPRRVDPHLWAEVQDGKVVGFQPSG